MTALREVRCPFDRCDGSGWVEVGENSSAPCECRAQRAAERTQHRLAGGIPKRFRGVGWERKPIVDLEPEFLAELRAYTGSIAERLDEGRGLWLGGPNGTGKTSVAMLVAKAAAAASRSFLVFPLPKLLAQIRGTFDADGGRYLELFEQVTTVDLLVLDDVGAEKRTDWVLEQLYSIVNERYQEERATVITTNSTSAELKAQVGFERIVSRFAEMCGQQLWIDGPDRRWESPR